MTRRSFLKLSAITAAASLGGAGLAHSAPRSVRLTRHRVPWRGPAHLRVAHLTDLHLGWGTPDHLLEQSIQLCRSARPDLVALTGDYLNRTVEYLPQLERVLARLPRPCVATLGNHDHWSGADEIERAMERQGVTVLRNAHAVLQLGSRQLPVVGVDDGFSGHDDVEGAFSGLSCPEAALVLTHFPSTAEQISTCGGRVVLAGHTHGGQVEIPVLTRAISRLAGSRYLAGWYSLGCTRLYVNAGIGSAAVRFRMGRNARPEVAIIELHGMKS